MLAEHFNDRIEGDVADFGAGWGYLGTRLLQVSFHVGRLDSIEADFASLAAARGNLEALRVETPLGFHWLDITAEPAPARYDWIIMNPPFHQGRAATPELGAAFISSAGRALKPGGRLLMVANRNLPYEAPLASNFASFAILAEEGRFKVIEAVR
jgi:16S rRNA (guanine1207-N2)-methyltransferase